MKRDIHLVLYNFLFDKAEREREPELLKDIIYKVEKKKHKDFFNIKLESFPSEKVLLILFEDKRTL